MKRIAFIAAVAFLLAPSAHCAADTTAQPTSQPSKAETFLLVEVRGTIGEDFSAAKLKAAIAEARKAKAAAIVLNMDTPGGGVAEAEAIVNLIIENKDLRFIALVNKALSAGAAITLACKEIYVMETATIGAAVPYIPDKRGLPANLPADVAEKMQSAWRAVCRKAADHGGHSSLLAEGMVDKDFAIAMRKENGKVILERIDREFGRTTRTKSGETIQETEMTGKGELLKARGRILTLTAKEAVACELAKAVVPDVAGLGTRLGIRLGGLASGTAAEQGPAPFYDLVSDKIDALGLVGNSLTELGRKAVDKEWDSWFDLQWRKARSERVSWTLVLVEAKPPKGGSFELYATTVARAKRLGILVTANVPTAYRDVVALIPRGGSVLIKGRVCDLFFVGRRLIQSFGYGTQQSVRLERPDETISAIGIRLDDCTIGDKELVQPASTTAPVDPDAEAKQRLNLAENCRVNGMTAHALKMLRSIITDFPNTASAKKAQEQLKELEDAAKKAGKDS